MSADRRYVAGFYRRTFTLPLVDPQCVGCEFGGSVKDGCIEIQGDKREKMKHILTEAGCKPVFAGG